MGERKAVPLFESVEGFIAEDVFGLGGSEGRSTTDEWVERDIDGCRGGLRLALRCGIAGGGLFLRDPSACVFSEKLLLDFGVAGGEGGRSGGNP